VLLNIVTQSTLGLATLILTPESTLVLKSSSQMDDYPRGRYMQSCQSDCLCIHLDPQSKQDQMKTSKDHMFVDLDLQPRSPEPDSRGQCRSIKRCCSLPWLIWSNNHSLHNQEPRRTDWLGLDLGLQSRFGGDQVETKTDHFCSFGDLQGL
jgi:hypothetical protein